MPLSAPCNRHALKGARINTHVIPPKTSARAGLHQNRAHPHRTRSAASRPANERKKLNGCLSSETCWSRACEVPAVAARHYLVSSRKTSGKAMEEEEGGKCPSALALHQKHGLTFRDAAQLNGPGTTGLSYRADTNSNVKL